MDLQASALCTNSQQLANLGGYMTSIGTEVGRATANNPIRSNVTLSQQNVIAGHLTDLMVLGSLTRKYPVELSIQNFDYGPYVQAYQPQPNDKNTRRVDEVTHQIVQKELPEMV